MLNLPLTLLSSCLLWLPSATAADYKWPSQPYDALEELLYEGARPDGSSLADLVRPCKLRGGTNTTVAAEWLRLVYHDTSTHNVSDGTGGLDGSIFFEIGRSENVGAGMNNTISDFSQYPNKYVTRADIIAIATIFATTTCGGPIVPFRGGRIDANAAGPLGVPDPSDSLESLTNNFAKQGYNVSEMIQLVACGHTLGGVRFPDFPTIVEGSGQSTVVQLFDETQQFDHAIISQYLDGTTRDPLVVGNQTMASDLRVFSSDNNVTMQSMNSAESFSKTCVTIFDKMLTTIPSGVTLTDEITLLPFKVSSTQLTVSGSQLQFQANLRVVVPSNSTTVQMYWCDRYGSSANCSGNLKRYASSGGAITVSSPVTTAMNVSLRRYQFVVPINVDQGISKFWFVVDYGNGTTIVADNGGSEYVVDQDDVLFVPSMSRDKSVLTGSNGVSVTAAVKGTPSHVFIDCFGRATNDFLPVNKTFDLTLNTSIPAVAGYNFYTGTATDDFGATMQFDIVAVGSDGKQSVDTYRQSGLIGMAIAPASEVQQTTAGKVGGASGAESVMMSLGSWYSRWGVAVVAGLWTLSYCYL
ncbi:peroxidase [Favolaschia claudopus]|uniref:Peroxidase n=1 Tax=Favolaschia claudopus TaxID=2862362 RepID=A0AAW0B073_9AGAR